MGDVIYFSEERIRQHLRKLKAEGEQGAVPPPGMVERRRKIAALMRLLDEMRGKRKSSS